MNPTSLFKKWQNVSGVKFPETAEKQFALKKASRPDPEKWITSTEAAKAAGITGQTLCAICRKRKLKYRQFRGDDGILRNYYLRRDIDKLLASRKATDGPPENGARLNYAPDGYVTCAEAMARIGCVRATIQRMLARNILRSVYYVRPGRQTQRLICAADLPAAAKRLAEYKAFHKRYIGRL